jgi:hypothetical protein
MRQKVYKKGKEDMKIVLRTVVIPAVIRRSICGAGGNETA